MAAPPGPRRADREVRARPDPSAGGLRAPLGTGRLDEPQGRRHPGAGPAAVRRPRPPPPARAWRRPAGGRIPPGRPARLAVLRRPRGRRGGHVRVGGLRPPRRRRPIRAAPPGVLGRSRPRPPGNLLLGRGHATAPGGPRGELRDLRPGRRVRAGLARARGPEATGQLPGLGALAPAPHARRVARRCLLLDSRRDPLARDVAVRAAGLHPAPRLRRCAGRTGRPPVADGRGRSPHLSPALRPVDQRPVPLAALADEARRRVRRARRS